MEQYTVTGMTCAACSARVERAVSAVDGVTACSVNLLMGSMTVEGDVPVTAVVAAVEAAGYGAAVKGEKKAEPSAKPSREGGRLLASAVFLLLLMYLSMGHGMWGWPLPSVLADNPMAQGLTQLLLTLVVMGLNRGIFVNGIKAACKRAPTMDTLVTLGSSAAFAYSTAVLYAMTAGGEAAAHGLHDLYYESAAMILTLITLGKKLEARSKGRTTDALSRLMDLSPRKAILLVDGEEHLVPAEQVKVGDRFAVPPGAAVPVDGVVEEGTGAVDESALTGESVPVDKAPGDTVSAATINRDGYLVCRATHVGEDTTLARIIQMVEDAASTKAPIAKMADKVAGIFVPTALGIAAVTLTVWLLLGYSWGYALMRGVAVLVISCPCALGLATPVAIMVGSGVAARNGVLFKTAAALEHTGRVRIVALDKTGTLTTGQPRLTDILPLSVSEEELLSVAYGLESRSEHPLARAVCAYAMEQGATAAPVTGFKTLPGSGVEGHLDGKVLMAGNRRMIEKHVTLPPEVAARADVLAAEGKTPLFFAVDGRLWGILAVADTLKPDSREAVDRLKAMGLRVVMLTGDNAITAATIGQQVGVDEVLAEVRPEDKEAAVRRLMKQGTTVMVGDGINDAPALTRADVGMAIGAGTDIAMDAADVVLMHSRLSDVPEAIRLSRAVLRNIRMNLFWAFFYNMAGIPLAAGVFIPLLGWQLSPMFGAAVMSVSSVCVVSNALRLNRFRFHAQKEVSVMEKTWQVEGMMCPHCEAHVKKALEGLSGVAEAIPSHQEGTVRIIMNTDVADDTIKAAIEAAGYKVK